MWNPFQDFPREYGTPGRKGVVYSCKELLEKMKLFNCKTDFYTSLYSFEQLNEAGNRGNYTTSVLNNLYLESDKGSLEPVLKLHEYCSTRNLYHSFFFSGRGFHFYIGTKPGAINKKGAITNAQVDICDSLDLKIGINGDSDIDGHVIGNLAQLVRVPNSFNIKRKYFCIPLRVEDLTTLEDIKQKAKKPRAGIPIYGKEKGKPEFSGKRATRGLYQSKNKTSINADINGSFNIMRKCNDNLFNRESVMAYGVKPVIKINVSDNLMSNHKLS